MFLVACISNALQRTCRGPKALAAGNMHAVLGWCFVTAVAALSVALPTQGSGAGARAMTTIGAVVSRTSAAVLGTPVQLRSWALTTALVLGILLLLTGAWSTLNCYDSPGFVGYEIGHLVPASMWIGTGAVALCFRRAAAQLDLQRMEGRLMVVLGGLFLAEITMAHHGGMFGSGGGYAARRLAALLVSPSTLTHVCARAGPTTTSSIKAQACCMSHPACWRWHLVNRASQPACICCYQQSARLSVRCYCHIRLASLLTHGAVIMSHVQFSEQSALMHQAHAGMLLVSALWRCARRVPEYSLFAALSGAAFIGSSECPVRFAEDVGFNAAGYALCVFAAAALLWTWAAHLAFGDAAATHDERRARKMQARSENAPLDDDV
jgi:hypothetical protein